MREGAVHGVRWYGAGDAVSLHECEECEGSGQKACVSVDESDRRWRSTYTPYSVDCVCCDGSGEIEDEIEESEGEDD